MQQRRLRLGDILDDYCPRERRVTNHVVVAMIEDEVKQTRCTTCDADHEYKQARVPLRRKKDDILPADALLDSPEPDPTDSSPMLLAPSDEDADAPDADAEDDSPRIEEEEDGPVHRRLIRATLPRPDGPSQEWKEPDFTVRQPGGNNNGRGGGGGFDGNRNGHRPGGQARGPRQSSRPPGNGQGGPARFGGPRTGGGQPGQGGPQGQGGNRPGGRGRGGGSGGQGQGRGQQPPGGFGRKRGR